MDRKRPSFLKAARCTQSLADWAPADLAASSHMTGHSGHGGDWVLEHQIGQVDAAIELTGSQRAHWHHDLNAVEISENAAATELDEQAASWQAAGTLPERFDVHEDTWSELQGSSLTFASADSTQQATLIVESQAEASLQAIAVPDVEVAPM